MNIKEKDLMRILKQPGYSINAPLVKKQPMPAKLTEFKGSKLEWKFIVLWDALKGQYLDREYKFHPKRRFRADFVHKPSMTMIEIEGYGHQKQNRYTTDLEKYNLAATMGWTLVRLTAAKITANDLQAIIDFIKMRT
jgi:very-short-patch-repair endonuclease